MISLLFEEKSWLDHTVADTTAILKLIGARGSVCKHDQRDAAQPDADGVFQFFTSTPWMTPPTPPAQTTSGACYVNQVP